QGRKGDPADQGQLEWFGEASQVAAKSEYVDAVPLNDHDHSDCHRDGEVDVRGGRLRRLRERKRVEPVGEQDEDEDGGGKWQDESRSLLGDHLLGQVAYVVEQQLEQHLQAPW